MCIGVSMRMLRVKWCLGAVRFGAQRWISLKCSSQKAILGGKSSLIRKCQNELETILSWAGPSRRILQLRLLETESCCVEWSCCNILDPPGKFIYSNHTHFAQEISFNNLLIGYNPRFSALLSTYCLVDIAGLVYSEGFNLWEFPLLVDIQLKNARVRAIF